MTQTDRQQLRELVEHATPGPWELQTSNSWRRIGTAGSRNADGNVLAPTTRHGDNHPDLAAHAQDLDFIVAANPATVLALLDALDLMEQELRDYKMAAQAEAYTADEARAEAHRFKALLIEHEATRAVPGAVGDDDQMQIDELVALGIQQDKDEITRLKAENADLRIAIRAAGIVLDI